MCSVCDGRFTAPPQAVRAQSAMIGCWAHGARVTETELLPNSAGQHFLLGARRARVCARRTLPMLVVVILLVAINGGLLYYMRRGPGART